jgi:carbon-monoxide dehydrogenase medium subunit
MKAAPFDYRVAPDMADAARALAGQDGGTKAIAGAQSLGPMLNLRLVRPGRLVDVSMLPELREARETTAGAHLGAAITHAEIEDGEVPDPTPGWLREAAANIAHRAVRNRGTLGGSLAHADPAADWVIVMTGLDATVVLEGPDGRREVTMADFITGPFETALRPGELISAVLVPRPGSNACWGYCKFIRQVGEFAKASATVLIDPDKGRPRIAIGALSRQPLVFEASVSEDLAAGRIDAVEALVNALPERSASELALHVTMLNRALAKARTGTTGNERISP